MESLSNFNFLKVNEIKKSNESKSNNKKLLDNENAFVTGKDEGIGNKIKNLLNDVELNKKLNAENSSSEKQTNKKSHKNKNVELPEASLVDASVKVLENENTNNLENITVEKQKGKKSFLNLAKGNSLNIDISNKEEKILDQNTNKVFNARSVVKELDNKIFNKIQPNLLVAKTNKYKTEAQNILNNNKKSKIKSFFQNYFNYKLKKYTKKILV